MLVSYRVEKSGTLELSNDDWEDLREDFRDDIEQYVLTTVSEAIREFDEGAIIITSIRNAS
ncbi:MAG: hypothetical protein V3S69_05045 [Dehalococcoidales bacterium]